MVLAVAAEQRNTPPGELGTELQAAAMLPRAMLSFGLTRNIRDNPAFHFKYGIIPSNPLAFLGNHRKNASHDHEVNGRRYAEQPQITRSGQRRNAAQAFQHVKAAPTCQGRIEWPNVLRVCAALRNRLWILHRLLSRFTTAISFA